MNSPGYPKLNLAQAIIKTIADHTGREVRGTEIYAFSDFLQVTVSMEEDGAMSVTFEDPSAPGSRSST